MGFESRSSDPKKTESIDNFRGRLWKIICKVDDLKYEVLNHYTLQRDICIKEEKQK